MIIPLSKNSVKPQAIHRNRVAEKQKKPSVRLLLNESDMGRTCPPVFPRIRLRIVDHPRFLGLKSAAAQTMDILAILINPNTCSGTPFTNPIFPRHNALFLATLIARQQAIRIHILAPATRTVVHLIRTTFVEKMDFMRTCITIGTPPHLLCGISGG